MKYESQNADDAVIRCPECNAEVGTTDEACSSCGAKMVQKKGAGAGSLLLVIVLVAALVAIWLVSRG